MTKKIINIIGRGNLGTHLAQALSSSYITKSVNPRTLEGIDLEAEACLIAVSDAAIGEVASRLPERNWVVAHTAGSVPMDVLAPYAANIGVLYPLMSFSKEAEIEYSEIPFFIEGNNQQSISLLKEMAESISRNVTLLDSKKREMLHLSGVVANNLTNALWSLTDDLLHQQGLDFSVMLPMLKQMVAKLERMSPKEAQTGPAMRGDRAVMEKHINQLASYPQLQEIYKLISDTIEKK